jgi:hypothetical protein
MLTTCLYTVSCPPSWLSLPCLVEETHSCACAPDALPHPAPLQHPLWHHSRLRWSQELPCLQPGCWLCRLLLKEVLPGPAWLPVSAWARRKQRWCPSWSSHPCSSLGPASKSTHGHARDDIHAGTIMCLTMCRAHQKQLSTRNNPTISAQRCHSYYTLGSGMVWHGSQELT